MIILIVGLGSMGKRRIRCMQALGFSQIIGFDLNEDRRREVEKIYKIDTVSTIDKALKKYPNCMIISTPPDLHYHYASIAIKNNIHFFTEVNLSSKDVSKIIKKMEGKSIVGMPSSTMLFHPIIIELKKLIKNKKIGKILSVYYHFGHYLPNWHPWEDYTKFYVSKKETGAAKEIVPFELVWMIELFSGVQSVYGNLNKISNLNTKIDDIYQIIIQFVNKIQCTMIVDVITEPAINEIIITGDKGVIRCDHNSGIIKIGKGDKWKEIKTKKEKIAKGYKGNTPGESTYIHEIKTFLNSIKNQGSTHYSFKDEFKILRVLDAIELSSKKGKKIII